MDSAVGHERTASCEVKRSSQNHLLYPCCCSNVPGTGPRCPPLISPTSRAHTHPHTHIHPTPTCVSHRLAQSGRSSVRLITTRTGRCPLSRRVVRRGLSRRSVLPPTTTASLAARDSNTTARLAGLLTHAECPAAADRDEHGTAAAAAEKRNRHQTPLNPHETL